MSELAYTFADGVEPASQLGDSLEALAATIADRKNADERSYTYRLLQGPLDSLLKKLVEEAAETALAAKDADGSSDAATHDHLRYEMGDVIYHLMVLMEREGVTLNEIAAELNSRMEPARLADRGGIVLLKEGRVNRGK